MPIFSYRCEVCDKEFERIVESKYKAIRCKCGRFAKRQFPNSFNFKLKGDGWAKDGYSKG